MNVFAPKSRNFWLMATGILAVAASVCFGALIYVLFLFPNTLTLASVALIAGILLIVGLGLGRVAVACLDRSDSVQ